MVVAVRVDEREQIAAHPALMGGDDGHHGVGRDRGVDGVAARLQRRDAGVRGQLFGSGDGAVDAADRGSWGVLSCRGSS